MDKAWHAEFAPWIARLGDIDRLITRTVEGIEIYPLYRQSQGPRAERPQYGPWTVMQRIDHPRNALANKQILEDLSNGADGLSLAMPANELRRTLDSVQLHTIAIRLEGSTDLAETFADYVAQLPIDPSRLNVSFCLDRSDQVTGLKKHGFKGPFLEADGRPHHGKGATVTEELACIIHEIVQSLRTVENPSEIAATMTADQDMFMTLAKFRALRLMWGRILEASEIAFSPLRIHAETSTRMMSALDPHMNILRATLAVFGAALGGADSICVLPYSIIQGLPNAHARRMARNTQLILSEETQLWRVADAASGSGYVESLTSELCKKAWSIFREIERTGRLPDFDSGNSRSAPVTGTTSNRLAEELPAAIESQA